jgi:hypothetical protein
MTSHDLRRVSVTVALVPLLLAPPIAWLSFSSGFLDFRVPTE